MTEQFNEFKSLVVRALNAELGIDLDNERRLGNEKDQIVIDLLDIDKGVFVELVPQQTNINFNKLKNALVKQNRVINSISDSLPFIQIVVFADILDKSVLRDFRLSLSGKLLDVEFLIFDREDISKLANKNAINPTTLQSSNKIDTESNFLDIHQIPKEFETVIDGNEQIVFGQKIGSEILKYNCFFLPCTSDRVISRSNIANEVLEILDINPKEISLDSDFLHNGYFWANYHRKKVGHNFAICFILISDKGVTSNEFKRYLRAALNKIASRSDTFIKNLYNSNLFIPVIDNDYTARNVSESFEIIKDSLPLILEKLSPKLVRVNLPFDLRGKSVVEYGKDFLTNLKEKTKDKIPFHLDNVETIDKLNREPVAKSLARLINKDIFDKEGMNHSFMVHLQGEWGSGKSTFLNLIENHLDTDHRRWVVIKYNAWQNQHITPPWWSFIDQIYRQGKGQLNWLTKRPRVWAHEKLRRWLWYSAWYNIASLGIFIFLLLVILVNFNTVFSAIGDIANLDADRTNTDVLTFILSFGTIIGLIFSLAKFISSPLALTSSEDAKRFTLRASDPMNRIKKHFNELINDFNNADREIAVFIDDIDRCNREYTIELLEGIQTLFKERRVLYIVAGDTKWITSCFKNNYSEFSEIAKSQGQNLGELFLEKAFQLSVRMPDVSEASKQAYWKEIIGDTFEQNQEDEHVKDILASEMREEIKERLIKNYNENRNDASERNSIKQEYNISGQQVTDLAIEALDEDNQDVRHLLLSFHSLISPNPRSIKRLANNYSMYRNTLIAEQTDFKPGHLFRWLLLEDKYPAIVKHFLDTNTVNKLDDFIKEKGSYTSAQIADLQTIIDGRDAMNEEALTIEELNQILRK